MIGVIKGTGSCVPGKVVTNDDIAGLVETSDGWIRERTGIEERHIATEETCVDLAAEAARRALQNAGMDAEELDMILVLTDLADPRHALYGLRGAGSHRGKKSPVL